MHATLFNSTHVKVISIDKTHYDNTEQVVVVQSRCMDLRKTAEQLLNIVINPVNRDTGTENFDQLLVLLCILFIHDGVTAVVQQVGRIDIPGHGKYLPCKLQRVAHYQSVGIARHRDKIVRLENTGLLEYAVSYTGQGYTISGGIKMFEPARYLCGL